MCKIQGLNDDLLTKKLIKNRYDLPAKIQMQNKNIHASRKKRIFLQNLASGYNQLRFFVHNIFSVCVRVDVTYAFSGFSTLGLMITEWSAAGHLDHTIWFSGHQH